MRPPWSDEAFEEILWWYHRENEKDTLLSLGLTLRILFGECKTTGEVQWAAWAGNDWKWPQWFICSACGTHTVEATYYEEWPVHA